MFDLLPQPMTLFLFVALVGVCAFEVLRFLIPQISATITNLSFSGLAIAGADWAGTIDWAQLVSSREAAYAIGLALGVVVWYMRQRTKPVLGTDR